MSKHGNLTLSLDRLLAVTGGQAFDVSDVPETGFLLSEPAAADSSSVAVLWRRDGLRQAAAAGLLVVNQELAEAATGKPRIVVDDARRALAQLSREFKPEVRLEAGIHPSAWVHADARVSATASIAAGVVIDGGASVGPGSVVMAGSTIGERSVIGSDCVIYAGVHIYHDVEIGDRVILHSGAVLGADGFGFATAPQGIIKIEHLGRVMVADDVELGANSTVDRGTIGPTVIGARTKIDNLVQIAHNVRIGSDCHCRPGSHRWQHRNR